MINLIPTYRNFFASVPKKSLRSPRLRWRRHRDRQLQKHFFFR